MAHQNEDAPKFPRLLLCEGAADQAFFHRLIDERRLPGFHIWNAGGNRQFAGALRAYSLKRPRTLKNCRHIIVAADNDDDPDKNFGHVRRQIDEFFGAGSAPTIFREKTEGNPSISILMLPWDKDRGHLERLCGPSAKDADRNIGDEVDHFLARLRADKWKSESRIGKAWLRTNLAARCISDPFVPLGRVFTEKKHHSLIPVNHTSLKPIADFLSTFGP